MSLDPVSKRVYEEEINPFLPDEIIDIHIHVGLPEHVSPIRPERLAGMWAMEIASSYSWQEMRDSFSLLFPDKKVTALAFGFPYQEVDLAANNAYVLQGIKDPINKSYALFLTSPDTSPDTISQALSDGFIGIKPYPDLAPGGYGDVSIYDFLPNEHLKVLDEASAVLVLHLPRKGRVADPDNIRELLEIYEKYPNVKIIVAHIGRAFCLPTAQIGLPRLAQATGLYYDFAANLNADVLEYAIQTVGVDKILYGSDLPITLMKGIREHVGDKYYNYTSGPYSWNTNRKSPEIEASYTYFLYEELKALITAAGKCGDAKEIINQITYTNAAGILGV